MRCTSGPAVSPRSTSSTKRGHACWNSSTFSRVIAVIDDRLPREVVEQRARNGQSADARVENADWPIVHRSKYTGAMLRPKHAFQALHRRSEVAAVRARREVLPSSVG